MNTPAIGSLWRNKRSGIVATVVAIERDCVRLSRPKMRETLKWLDHFNQQYVEAEKPIPLTPERFETLLTAYTDAYGAAILAAKGEEYRAAIDKAGDAKFALTKAVFA